MNNGATGLGTVKDDKTNSSITRKRTTIQFTLFLLICCLSIGRVDGRTSRFLALKERQNRVVRHRRDPSSHHFVSRQQQQQQRQLDQCENIKWREACDGIISSENSDDSNRRQQRRRISQRRRMISDRRHYTYDENCLRMYRIQLGQYNNQIMNFPYYANQKLFTGGNQSMAVLVQHGARRNADFSYCTIHKLLLSQYHSSRRKSSLLSDMIIIAPQFSYKNDPNVRTNDTYWNTTKVVILVFFSHVILFKQLS
jgi:hypothetical protein